MIETFYRPDDLEQRIAYEVKNKISGIGSNVPMPDQDRWIEWISDIVYCILTEYHNKVLTNQFNGWHMDENWTFRMTKEKAEQANNKVEALANKVLELENFIKGLSSLIYGPEYAQKARFEKIAMDAIRTGE